MAGVQIESTIGRITEEIPGGADLLMQLGIDPARHCDEPLCDVCAAQDLDAGQVLAAMMSVEAEAGEERDWSGAPLDEVLDHLIAVDHAFLRRQLPRIGLLLKKVRHDFGDQVPEGRELYEEIGELTREMQEHLAASEEVLFPMIRELQAAADHQSPASGPVDRLMRDMRHVFDEAGEHALRLREITHRFGSPGELGASYQGLMQELGELIAATERHAYLERDILCPRVVELESRLIGRGSAGPGE